MKNKQVYVLSYREKENLSDIHFGYVESSRIKSTRMYKDLYILIENGYATSIKWQVATKKEAEQYKIEGKKPRSADVIARQALAEHGMEFTASSVSKADNVAFALHRLMDTKLRKTVTTYMLGRFIRHTEVDNENFYYRCDGTSKKVIIEIKDIYHD